MKNWLRNKIKNLFSGVDFDILIPPDEKMGDFSANIAFVLGKIEGKNPMAVGEEVLAKLKGDKELTNAFEKIEVVKPGFINFYLNNKFLQQKLGEITAD
ncbi:MAG: hypothetical protein ACK4NX_01675, partial [Candidatus Paceibacteria bacterium]